MKELWPLWPVRGGLCGGEKWLSPETDTAVQKRVVLRMTDGSLLELVYDIDRDTKAYVYRNMEMEK